MTQTFGVGYPWADTVVLLTIITTIYHSCCCHCYHSLLTTIECSALNPNLNPSCHLPSHCWQQLTTPHHPPSYSNASTHCVWLVHCWYSWCMAGACRSSMVVSWFHGCSTRMAGTLGLSLSLISAQCSIWLDQWVSAHISMVGGWEQQWCMASPLGLMLLVWLEWCWVWWCMAGIPSQHRGVCVSWLEHWGLPLLPGAEQQSRFLSLKTEKGWCLTQPLELT